MTRVTVSLLILSIIIELTNSELTDVVFTTKGGVKGEIFKTALQGREYLSFRGIPFAKPPVGDLRFKAPVPPDNWTEVKMATEEHHMCPQLGSNKEYIGDEDCLYLNVYIPLSNSTGGEFLLAVLVNIYGGSFATGSKIKAKFGPDYFIEQNVVLVTLNYRLGPLGFLCINDSQMECNLGLKDQHLALVWVKENIRQFGGDPDQITLSGQSAGSVSVQLHMLSQMSKGLFNRTFSESGSPLCAWGYETPSVAYKFAYELADEIAGHTVNKSEAVSVLRSASAKDLIEKTDVVSHGIYPHFTPTVEENPDVNPKFLSNCPIQIMLSGNYTKVPQMLGYTRDEAVTFSEAIGTLLYFLNKGNVDTLVKISKNIPQTKGLLQKVASTVGSKMIADVVDLATDDLFKSCIDLGQRIYSKNSDNNIYMYEYDYVTDNCVHTVDYRVNKPGVGHGDDLGSLYWIDSLHQTPESRNPSAPNNQMAYIFTSLVANFMKFNDPTPPGGASSEVKWPDSRENGTTMNITLPLNIIPRQVNERAKRAEVMTYEIARRSNGCSSGFN